MPKGPHYSLIARNLPDWLGSTAWPRAQALGQVSMAQLPPLLRSDAQRHGPIKLANAQAWATQNTVDQRLKDLQDVYAFAAPLLTAALLQRYAIELDVRTTHLFLVIAKGTVLKGTTSRTVSLLDAALQNFAGNETFTDTSSYITRPDARGHFMIEMHKDRMSIAQFVALCRELDIGAQYARHLKQHLLDGADLQPQVIASQQAALANAAHLAQLHTEIEPATFHLLQRTVKGERGVMQFYRLRMQGTLLTGILLVATDLDRAADVVPVVAYIPHDPHGAIREFPSTLALRNALLEQLKAPDYCQFFSQFVDHAERSAFFSGLQQHPTLAAERIDGDLWLQLYQAALNKILNDGRSLAVSTADADRRARWAWWDKVSQTLEGVLNVALLVITPFVPLLGEVMLAYTAYQLLDELVEGVVDLAEGQAMEAAGHFVGVVSDVVQLGAFGVGGELAQSVFVNGLKPVEVNGKTRLWNPDPQPYRQNLQLPAGSIADESGLHSHLGQRILRFEGEHYAVKHEAGQYRIQHATRADAYAPPLQRNDSPRAWSDQRRLQALGPFIPAQHAQILRTSGLDHATLRAVQADTLAAPLLDDTLKRVRLHQQASDLPEQLRAGQPVDQDTYWSPHVARELPGWPHDRAILVYEHADLSGEHLRFGEPDAPHTLAISRDDLNQGRLPERLVDTLDTPQLTGLLGELPDSRAARIDALRNRLADHLAQRRGSLFAYLYRHSEDLTTERGLRVREACPGLPKSLVRHILEQARPDELAVLDTQKRLPLRLKNLAREWQLQARSAHAYQGFYDPQLLTPQTEQMVLDALRLFSDNLHDCRIEIRQHTPIANVRASAGPQDARQRRLLLKTDGVYEVYDEHQQRLQPAADLFDALLNALPTAKREALGTGQALKGWVMDTLLAPEARRTVMAGPQPGTAAPTAYSPWLQKPMHPVAPWSSDLFPGTLEQRVKVLYPYAEQALIDSYLHSLSDPLQRQRFEAREIEKAELHVDLSNWINTAPISEAPGVADQRYYLAKALLRTWEENLGTDDSGVRLSLQGIRLTGLLGNLRLRANFDHVLHLEMIDAGLLDNDTLLLDSFPQLVSLSLRGNQLTQLPQAIRSMPSLTYLSLESNPIEWAPVSLRQLAELSHLRQLSLGHNRHLVQAPNLAGLPHLEALSLRNTGISDWPEGLFDQPRPWGFYLDVQNTAINRLPQFLPWQPEAQLLAYTRLDRNHLSASDDQLLVSYRLEIGLDPYRSYPPKGDARFWLETETPQHQAWLQELWQDIEAEHGSQGFFEVLKSLEPSTLFEDDADAELYEQGRGDLTDKVWRMLLAMATDADLRTRLFQMASNPVTCADAGAHTFNAMGIEVQLVEINRDLHGQERELKLAHLARGKSRLDRLNQAAQADIRQRIQPRAEGGQGLRFSTNVIDGEPGTVDEVEVYLAYHSGLKARLKLPWVSPHMHYRATAEVDLTLLNRAFDHVMRLEAGDGLVDGMREQAFWDRYLRDTHASAFQASIARANALIDPLDDLLFTQNQWASAGPAEQALLKPRLQALADAVNAPHAEVFSGQPMSPQTYERLLAAGFTDAVPSEENLARRLTRDVVQRLQGHESGPDS
ncbi:NEL-type E3 ubiquitin ligase domain-containing protein [Pseudomonas sp. 18175]|uniref:NEL-type E3 ubiquitin ligase domain-containing protein n=1 Tax=Pseudomonas sp. 18175 TaxID=3390056 RepID=UPI003D1A6BC4